MSTEMQGARRKPPVPHLTAMPAIGGRAVMSLLALLLLLAGVVIATATGYWFGQRSGQEQPAAAPAGGEGEGRKILYYRNPMGLPSTSPTPKKDPMGMDYIPVFEGEDAGGGGIDISAERVQKLGVRVIPVERRALDETVRTSGRIEADERRLATVTAKFDGFIEKLHVNTTGQPVGRGAPLFDAFSPELLAAQREYVVAAQGLAQLHEADAQARAGMQRLAEAALARLRLWDVTEEEIARLVASGEPRRTLTFRAPADGVVVERKAVQGMRFAAGETLFGIADFSSVWLIADVAEQDIGRVRVGMPARVRLDAYPGEVFDGRVTFIAPTLRAEIRSAQVRVELDNRDGRLKPAMFAQVELPVTTTDLPLVVPRSAVIDSGVRSVVIVDRGAGRFESREVKTGRRGDESVVINEGLREGESVVVAANFLIDAESNLRAALADLKGGSNTNPDAVPVVHAALGTLDDIDITTGTLLITHEPVASLNWPAMTMEFVPSDEAVAKAAQPGDAIRFEFIERKPGEWVVTAIERRVEQ